MRLTNPYNTRTQMIFDQTPENRVHGLWLGSELR